MDLHDARLIWEVLSRHLKAKSRLIRGEVNLLRKCNAIKLAAQLLPWLEAGRDYEPCGGDRGDHACQRDEAARNPFAYDRSCGLSSPAGHSSDRQNQSPGSLRQTSISFASEETRRLAHNRVAVCSAMRTDRLATTLLSFRRYVGPR